MATWGGTGVRPGFYLRHDGFDEIALPAQQAAYFTVIAGAEAVPVAVPADRGFTGRGARSGRFQPRFLFPDPFGLRLAARWRPTSCYRLCFHGPSIWSLLFAN